MTSRRTGVCSERNTDRNNDKDSQVERQEIIKTHDKTKTEERQSSKEKTMTKHIETRKKIRRIADVSTFKNLLEQTTLSDIDKRILILHYLDDKDFRYIGDTLGFSESTIKKRHRKILSKLSNML